MRLAALVLVLAVAAQLCASATLGEVPVRAPARVGVGWGGVGWGGGGGVGGGTAVEWACREGLEGVILG